MHPPPPASTLAAMNLQPGPLDRVVGLDDGSRESLLRVTPPAKRRTQRIGETEEIA